MNKIYLLLFFITSFAQVQARNFSIKEAKQFLKKELKLAKKPLFEIIDNIEKRYGLDKEGNLPIKGFLIGNWVFDKAAIYNAKKKISFSASIINPKTNASVRIQKAFTGNFSQHGLNLNLSAQRLIVVIPDNVYEEPNRHQKDKDMPRMPTSLFHLDGSTLSGKSFSPFKTIYTTSLMATANSLFGIGLGLGLMGTATLFSGTIILGSLYAPGVLSLTLGGLTLIPSLGITTLLTPTLFTDFFVSEDLILETKHKDYFKGISLIGINVGPNFNFVSRANMKLKMGPNLKKFLQQKN